MKGFRIMCKLEKSIMDLNNITVDSLKEKFAALDKKTYIKFGIGIGAIIFF